MSGPRADTVRAGVLDVGYERWGTVGGPPVVLLHGFPYAVRGYDRVAGRLAAGGSDVVVPHLRGYGPTRFVDAETLRSGQQAALAHDLHELLVALELAPAVVAGYDWGGRAACLVAMLWPERVAGLVTTGGYNVQDIARSGTPLTPEEEQRLWYQYYFHSDRGHAGLSAHRADLARLLWHDWSPDHAFSDAEFAASAAAFDNPDFVDVVTHSYRHRYGLVDGDPAYEASEVAIAAQPSIDVPTVVVDPTRSGLNPPSTLETHRQHFTRIVDHVRLPVGHNPGQEAPEEFAAAIERLLA